MTATRGRTYTPPPKYPEKLRALPAGKDATLNTLIDRRSPLATPRVLRVVLAWCAVVGLANAEVRLPTPSSVAPITLQADSAARWTEGVYEVRQLHGEVMVRQGELTIRGSRAVVWVERGPHNGPLHQPAKLLVYFEGLEDRPVLIATEGENGPVARQQATTWFGRLHTTAGVDWRTPEPIEHTGDRPDIAERGFAQFSPRLPPPPQPDPNLQPAQFRAPLPPALAPPTTAAPPGAVVPNPGGIRRVRIFPRSDVGAQAEFRQLPSGESVAVVSGGVNVLVDGAQFAGLPEGFAGVDSIDLETDRAVIWTAGADLLIGGEFEQANEVPLEVYLEGNIVFRQGDRTVYADRMYYDVRRRTGVVLNAELLAPLPENEDIQFRGLVRLKAGVLRQLDASRFVAEDGLVTTSRLEEPSYSFRSDTITFTDLQQPVIDPLTGQQAIDPRTGLPSFTRKQLARSRENTVEVGGVPIFYWPTIATDLKEPTFYIDDLRVRNDSIFGTQVLLDLDVYQLLGIEPIAGTDWTVGLDILSERGLGHGTRFEYDIDSFAGLQGRAVGDVDFFGIRDSGVDNLGLERRAIIPEETYRGRAFWNHRQKITDGALAGWIAQAEVGWISDRTFLEQYYEQEWDQNKDATTGIRLKRLRDNRSLSIEANVQINDFFTETQWLPRLDHYILGQDVVAGAATWFGHTSIGYANIGVATTPDEPTLLGQFALFPWEQDAAGNPITGRGERLVTRHEIDYPINLAPFKVVPYALGEIGTWGQDLEGNQIDRAFGQFGVRASLPMWRVNPAIRDPLFNLNGLAHKVVFDAELSYADANEDFDQFPLYDELDDNSIEEIRRRFFQPGFGGGLAGTFYVPGAPSTIDARFDPRFYAIRSGIQGSVAAPTFELAEDQIAARFGMRHRLQTKRGLPGQQRIVDWLIFDANATYFPDADRDNIGADVGMINYDAVWNLGDRFSVVSDGYADTFGSGLRMYSGGVRLGRPSRLNSFIGYRTISGPFNADLLTTSIFYRPTPKWLLGASAVVDFSQAGNIGQSVLASRIGESLLTTIRINVDESKNNVGVSFLVEPRVLPRLNLTRESGIDIPPSSFEYLE